MKGLRISFIAFIITLVVGLASYGYTNPPEENAKIYTKVGKVFGDGKCLISELHYFDDNGTPYDPKDDTYLGRQLAIGEGC